MFKKKAKGHQEFTAGRDQERKWAIVSMLLGLQNRGLTGALLA